MGSNSNVKPIVGVIGANSLVGDGLLPLLVEQGKSVIAFSRHCERHQDGPAISWQPLGAPLPAGTCIEQWISLAPIWILPAHFDWMRRWGAQRVVALSSTSRFTKVDSSSAEEQALARRLADGEEELARWAEAQGIAWTVLRPTLIYGMGRDKNVTVIAGIIRRFGFFPLLGKARGLRQPIHVQDLAFACASALEQPLAVNRAFNVSGAEVLAYRDMVARIFTAMNRQTHMIEIPMWWFRVAIYFLKLLRPFRKWSTAMVERMNRDMAFDHSDAMRCLNFSPRGFVLEKEDLP